MSSDVLVDVYARVSTEDQNVEQQVKHIKKWCKNNGYKPFLILQDKESGTKPLKDRYKFNELLKRPERPVVIYNLDRMTRNWDDIVLLEQHFRKYWVVSPLISTSDPIDLSTAGGRLMFRMKMVFACYMPEDMLEKQKVGIERAKKQGKYKGRKKGAKGKNNK